MDPVEIMNGLIGIEPQRLTPKQRRVQLVNNFEAEVFNGGWDQYIFNSGGNDAEEFRNLAIQLGYAGIASALSTLAHQMGGSIPKDRTKRSILLTRFKETMSEAQEEQSLIQLTKTSTVYLRTTGPSSRITQKSSRVTSNASARNCCVLVLRFWFHATPGQGGAFNITTQCTGFSVRSEWKPTSPTRPGDRQRYAGKAAVRFRNRHPMFYIATLASALVGHFMLCYPASVSRGHPPISLFWECNAIYLAFLSPAIAPAFEDFSDSPVIRKTILSVFGVVAAVMTAVPLTNMAGARPRIGHLAGYFGVWRYDWGTIMMKTVVIAAMAVPFVICVESIARSAWASVRQLPSVNGRVTA